MADAAVMQQLAPTGKLRVAIAIAPSPSAQFAIKDEATGAYRGVAVILGAALAKKLGVPAELIAVHTGEGVLTTIWHTYAIIDRYTPQLVPAMRAARQQQGELSFTAINALHYPLALIAMALLPFIVWLAWRKTIPAALGELAATVALALLANAFVCGALSNPHDRYGARMVWLATLAVIVALTRLAKDRLGSPRNLA